LTCARLSTSSTFQPSYVYGLALSIVFSLILPGVDLHGQTRTQVGRPLSLDDLFNLQQFARYYGGPFVFSSDGQQLAFVIQRPLRTAEHLTFRILGNERADVYVVSSAGGHPVNITKGLAEGAGYWAPSWSPDGKRLALLSTKGDKVNLWVWERASGSLRRLTDRSLDLYTGFDLYSIINRPYVWVSATCLLVPVLPRGAKPVGQPGDMREAEKANAAWPKSWRGKETAVSVLTSGIKSDLSKRPHGELLAIDVNTSRSLVVMSGAVRHLVVSPDQKTVACVRQVEVYQPNANDPLPLNITEGKFKLEVVSSDGMSLLPRDPATYDVIPTSLRWSPDGAELAFLSYSINSTGVPQLVRFLRTSRKIRSSGNDEIDPLPLAYQSPQLEWTRRGWIVYASRNNQSTTLQAYARRDWWLVSEEGSLRALTNGMTTAPSKLWREAGRDSHVGLANGKLWRISAEAPPQNVIPTFERRINAIVWPHERPGTGDIEMLAPGMTYSELVISVRVAEKEELFAVDLTSRRLTMMPKPTPNANVSGLSPASRATLYSLNDRAGLRLWLARDPSAQASTIFEANIFLQEVEPGTHQKIEYRSIDGQALSGWVLLPPGYQRGDRCPLVVWVYPGSMASTLPSPADDISSPSSLNMQIVASRGYAVLEPSIPLNPEGYVDDPMLKLTTGVLPAIDKVVELGIADPERIFVMGHSLGGFTTYGLITQTHRFKAAVAIAGLSNLTSGYGQFSPATRYDDYPHENAYSQARIIETALHLGSPPWKDIGRYLRNSPIFYVDRVQTPLMIIHGDMDSVPIEQAEEFFRGLYRQGKRAEFVRYWGEGHVIESPANICDMWERIFAWFEEFSPAKGDGHQQKVGVRQERCVRDHYNLILHE